MISREEIRTLKYPGYDNDCNETHSAARDAKRKALFSAEIKLIENRFKRHHERCLCSRVGWNLHSTYLLHFIDKKYRRYCKKLNQGELGEHIFHKTLKFPYAFRT